MKDLPDEILEFAADAVVEIQRDRRPAGLGFFVAATTVVTAESVVDPGELTSGDPDLRVVDRAGNEYILADARPERSSAAGLAGELAILRVRRADPASVDVAKPERTQCVLLDPEVRHGDPVVAVGWGPERSAAAFACTVDDPPPVGAFSAHLRVEGPPLAVAGAPLVCVRTRGVCGVFQNPAAARPAMTKISALSELSPQLESKNTEAHALNREWAELLLGRATPPPRPVPDDPLEAVVITTRPGLSRGQDEWQVTTHAHRASGQVELVNESFVDFNVVRSRVARIFRDWAARREPAQLVRVKASAQIELLAEVLSGAMLKDPVRDLLRAALAPGRREEFDVVLDFAERDVQPPAGFVYLPWEHLCVPMEDGSHTYLAVEKRVCLMRLIETTVEASGPAGAPPDVSADGNGDGPAPAGLTALMACTSPPGGPRPAPSVMKIIDGARRVNAIEFEVIERATGGDLALWLGQDRPRHDVLHYVGFGGLEGDDDRLALEMGNEPAYKDSRSLAGMLTANVPRVVVLQLCELGPEPVQADLTTFALDLLRKGVEAVVAYQYPVEEDRGPEFAEQFYTELAKGNSVERAVQYARWHTFNTTGRDSHAFLAPAVFVRERGGVVLAPAPAAREPASHITPGTDESLYAIKA